MKESSVNSQRVIVSYRQTAKAADPGKGAFDFITPSVSLFRGFPKFLLVLPVLPIRRDEFDSTLGKNLSQRIAVIPFICDESLGTGLRTTLPSIMDSDVFESLVYKGDFRWRGRVEMASKWNTLTVDHHHPLRSFSPFGFPDSRAPFFAGAKLPSINDSFQSRIAFLSSWARNSRHISNHRPCSSHNSRRLRHVLPLGYGKGTSLQRAPVFKTQRIPSSTSRLPLGGRPLRGVRSSSGSNGLILNHCSSVSIGLGRLIGSPPKRLIQTITQKYKYLMDNRAIPYGWNFGTISSNSGLEPPLPMGFCIV